jgi:hypothetical protein
MGNSALRHFQPDHSRRTIIATSKKTQIANAVNSVDVSPIASLTDLGYRQGATRDALKNQAKYAIANIVGFPESIDDSAKEKLFKGYQMRFNDNNPPKTYGIVDGNYLDFETLTNDAQSKVKEKVEIGVDVVFSYTQQEYGKLKTSDPAKYAVYSGWREGFIDYRSGCLGDLKAAARKELKKAAGDAGRAANLDFSEYIERKEGTDTKGVLEDMLTRCRTASKRKDATADLEKLQKSIAAFKSIWIG